ncbi:hypothetical protein BKA66DRAFT_470320 [Pyrenochaeta sp. MPI-SDFR-AT-0127]|nr:hypothetical protein BKA66DRAFT_470320 [Pyrenochaeta sp. MPI-SDFR-AT-0127]
MYCDKEVANREGNRRLGTGATDVRIYEIDMWRSSMRREYRNVRRLAKQTGVKIPSCAWNNSEYEYIVFRHVPEKAIVSYYEPSECSTLRL